MDTTPCPRRCLASEDRPVRRAPRPAAARTTPWSEHDADDDIDDWDDDGVAGPVDRLRAWLAPTPRELRGIALLLALALALTVGLLLSGRARPMDDPEVDLAGLAAVGPAIGADGTLTDESDLGVTVPPADPAVLVAHVTGAVRRPGLVRLATGARVGDAVEAAGGLEVDADLARVNLARAIIDGEHVHVVRVGETAPSGGGATDPSQAAGARLADGRLDINRATAEEFATLPGIGPVKAAEIVAHRERVGPFAVVGDLRDVPGIGEVTFQRIAPLVAVG